MRLFFSSYHNYLDMSSGAAISARSVLLELARSGWEIRVLCGAFFDNTNANEQTLYDVLKRYGILYSVERKRAVIDGKNIDFRLVRFNDSGIDATVFLAADVFSLQRFYGALSTVSGKIFLKLFVDEFQKNKPNVYLTYGGYWAALPAARIAGRLGAVSVFYLCNFAYDRRELFAEFDSIVVPSDFAKTFYRKKLNVNAFVLPPLIDERKVVAGDNSRQFLTFVNPSPEKGRYFFIGIARELNRLRPDIPILIIEGRVKINSFASTLEARSLTNLFVLENVEAPRDFYRQTRILLVPSLWNESFGRVAVEAAFNQIPVVCSNRGALPEVVADSEFILNAPSRFTPTTRIAPTAEEVRPWIEAIVKLWDDPALAAAVGARLQLAAEPYRYKTVADKTNAFFTDIVTKK